VDCALPIGAVLDQHRPRIAPVPGVRVGEDGPLRLGRLSEEEPVPPRLGESGVSPRERFSDGHGVERHEMADPVWMVESGAERHVRASIMSHDREAAMAEALHEPHDVTRRSGSSGGVEESP
jgi:hypothetical protein